MGKEDLVLLIEAQYSHWHMDWLHPPQFWREGVRGNLHHHLYRIFRFQRFQDFDFQIMLFSHTEAGVVLCTFYLCCKVSYDHFELVQIHSPFSEHENMELTVLFKTRHIYFNTGFMIHKNAILVDEIRMFFIRSIFLSVETNIFFMWSGVHTLVMRFFHSDELFLCCCL